MKRLVIGALVTVLAGVAAPVHASTTYGSTSGVNGVLYDDCVDQAYHYTVDVPPDAGYRAVRSSLIAPTGKVVRTDYVAPDANQASGTSTLRICRPADPFGTYTIRARVEWGPDAEHPDQFSAQLADAHFSMRKPRTRTSLAVSTHQPAYGQVVIYRIFTRDERPGGYYPTSFAWVFLQRRVDGHWVRVRGSRTLTHSTGRVRLRLRYLHHHKPMRYRAVTEPSSRFGRSVSPSIRLW